MTLDFSEDYHYLILFATHSVSICRADTRARRASQSLSRETTDLIMRGHCTLERETFECCCTKTIDKQIIMPLRVDDSQLSPLFVYNVLHTRTKRGTASSNLCACCAEVGDVR